MVLATGRNLGTSPIITANPASYHTTSAPPVGSNTVDSISPAAYPVILLIKAIATGSNPVTTR